ncbi:MAG: hypothetical protein ABEK16_04770 [Candidatus Nanohalobium sp.]
MENNNERILDNLKDPSFTRTLEALKSERDNYIDRSDLARLSGTNPPKEVLEEMEEMDMLEVKQDDSSEKYRLKEDSDAYWFLQMSAQIMAESENKSMIELQNNPAAQQQFFKSLGSQATSMEEFMSTWNYWDN